MTIDDYEKVYELWMSCAGMGLNNLDYSKEGIAKTLVKAAMNALQKSGINKVALVVFDRNETGNDFWEKMGFTVRNDLIYRNKALVEMVRIDT